VIEALLHGKLSREQKNMEDILTSNVFGLMEYLPPEEALFPFLAESSDLVGEHPLAFLRDVKGGAATYTFWPWWPGGEGRRGCEPDVVVEIDTDGRSLLVLVEAKYRSGKSSGADEAEDTPPNDQLAREWDNLRLRAREADREPFLLYVTTDPGRPRSEMEDSVREYRAKRPGDSEPLHMLWLSWRHFPVALGNSEERMIGDLRAVLLRLGLEFFCGFRQFSPISRDAWRFRGVAASFVWDRDPGSIPRAVDWRAWGFRASRPQFGWTEVSSAGRLEWGFRP
jgi:hypothetical protein